MATTGYPNDPEDHPPDTRAQSALGLSIGSTNLAAARPGRAAVVRRAVLTLRAGRPAEVGAPSENPEPAGPHATAHHAEPARRRDAGAGGVVLRGFVERVGDPAPLVGADGSSHRAEALLTTALEALCRAIDNGWSPGSIVVATPAHWGAGALGALRGALRQSPTLSPGGVAPLIVSDAAAALAALRVSPGLPAGGVVVLCDFGGSGSSITLVDAGADCTPIAETTRCADFSGDRIDEALLGQVLAGVQTSGADTATAAVGDLARLREQCRLAKQRLSTAAETDIPVDLPGHRSDIRITRAELDTLIAEPFAGFLDALGDALERNGIPAARITAIALAGGGAAIPAIGRQLSEALAAPVIAGGVELAATGAALLAARGATPDAPTRRAPVAADAPTSLAASAWAAGAAGRAATESATDGSPSATFRALAWSEGDAEEPVPYSGADYRAGGGRSGPGHGGGPDYGGPDYGGPDYSGPEHGGPEHGVGDYPTAAAGPVAESGWPAAAPLPWYRRPPLLFGAAAALAAVAVGGLAVTLTNTDSTPTTTTTRVTKPGEVPGGASPPAPTPVTTTITGGDGQPTVTTITVTPTTSAPPPEPTSTAPPTTPSTTTTPTTTAPTTTTTPTTTAPTTTAPTTTTAATTTPTTTRTLTTTPTTTNTAAPPTTAPPTTAPPPTSTVAPLTTAAPPPATAALTPPAAVEPGATPQAVVPEEAGPATDPAAPG